MGTGGAFEDRPNRDHLASQPLNKVVAYGTLSPTHMKRMRVQVIRPRDVGDIPPLRYSHVVGRYAR